MMRTGVSTASLFMRENNEEALPLLEKKLHGFAAPDAVLTECEGAMDALGALSGRSVREDVTQEIFSRFCVGK